VNRFVVIGLGHFGATVARRLYELGHEVLAVDLSTALVDAIGPYVTRAIAGDATKRDVLDEAGADGADVGVVAIGDNLGASILSLLALRDLKVANIYVKVMSEDHARIADALGATETVFPERQAATNLAARVTSGKLLHYTAYGEQFAIQEMAVPESWAGKTLAELKLPEQLDIQIVAIHDILRDILAIPKASQRLTPSDSLLIAGSPDQLAKLTTLR
jgi:trk system potassium uptake protein TrkA